MKLISVSTVTAALLAASMCTAIAADNPKRLGFVETYKTRLFPGQPTAPDAAHALIPHGRVAEGKGLAAWYSQPTDRYGHGVLGDAIEGGSLVVHDGQRSYLFELAGHLVFEDLRPRIVDMDQDGAPEILTITSSQSEGAGVELYGVRDGELVRLARSNFIGRANRWLNPAGVADYDGDGTNEIAYIETPHIGGQIVLLNWDKANGRLTEERRRFGYSTHVIGSTVLDMVATVDWNRDGAADLVLPRQDRRYLAVVSMAGGVFEELYAYKHADAIVTPLRLGDADADGKQDLLYGLANGLAWRLTLPGP